MEDGNGIRTMTDHDDLFVVDAFTIIPFYYIMNTIIFTIDFVSTFTFTFQLRLDIACS